MKIYLLLVLIVTLINAKLTGTPCDCTELQSQNECTQTNCGWEVRGGVSSCIELTPADQCPYLSTQTQCGYVEGCAWTNGGSCAVFTKCSDYTVTQAGDCYKIGTGCIPGSTQTTGTQCKSGTFSCSSITDPEVCQGLLESGTNYCFWVSSSCKSLNVSTCSSLIDETICVALGCTYSNSVCSVPQCSSITAQSSCTYLRVDDIQKQQLCTWKNNVCSDAFDAQSYTSTTCFPNTAGTYTWRNGMCTACTGLPFTLTTANTTDIPTGNNTNSTSSNSQASRIVFFAILLILQI